VENFVFHNSTKIIFGKGTEEKVGEETARYSKKVLLHYGQGSIKRIGLYDRVVKSLNEAGVAFIELGGVQPNPRLRLVERGIEICRKENIDFILAVGGGSVIDSAKAIAIGVPYDGHVWDFFERKAEPQVALSVGVVLTIPAAGSEASASAVITNEAGPYKRGMYSLLLRPKFAIMNPEITFSLSPYQTACGIADMMAHVMERYFTPTKNVELTDRLCEATLKTIIHNAPIVLKEPENYDARAEIMWASTIAHNDLLNTGRIGDWATHAMEHELSAFYDIPHGAGLAILFPYWMRYVYKRDVERFAQFAHRVWGVEVELRNLEETALEGIERFKSFFKSIGLPTSLKEANIPDDRLEEMAEKATWAGSIGNFVKLGKEDVLQIYKMARG